MQIANVFEDQIGPKLNARKSVRSIEKDRQNATMSIKRKREKKEVETGCKNKNAEQLDHTRK